METFLPRVVQKFSCLVLFSPQAVIVLSWNNFIGRFSQAFWAGVKFQGLTTFYLPTSWYMAVFGIARAEAVPVVKMLTRKVVSNYGR